jgi:hypothetical protein
VDGKADIRGSGNQGDKRDKNTCDKVVCGKMTCDKVTR